MNELHAYRKLAEYYDLIYSFKDYKKEAEEISKLILKYKKNEGKSLLDVGCGTGLHIKYLKPSYDCVGVDLNEEMLKIARRNVKGVKFLQGNMLSLNIKQKFDVVTCLFSAIGYAKTAAQLRNTLSGFYKHLNPGGICIIDAWFDKEHWRVGSVHLRSYDGDTVKISRVGYSAIKGEMSILDEHYLIAEKNKGVMYIQDKSELRLTEREEFLQLLEEAGFKPILLKKAIMGRDRYIGIKE